MLPLNKVFDKGFLYRREVTWVLVNLKHNSQCGVLDARFKAICGAPYIGQRNKLTDRNL